MPYIGEIRYFAGTFAPQGWAFCDGQLLSIAQYSTLFSVLGTTYGGDGKNTFALPDLRGRAPMHPGRGPGLTPRMPGEKGGRAEVTLTSAQIPGHEHALMANSSSANAKAPGGNVLSGTPSVTSYLAPAAGLVPMDDRGLEPTGGGQPHDNLQPYLTLEAIIALEGEYPSRS